MSGLDTSQPLADAASLHAGGEDEAAAPFDRQARGEEAKKPAEPAEPPQQ
jgi:hypothetical protein